jgi:hypothetical protein
MTSDLVSLGITFDVNGMPSVASVDHVIKHPPMAYDFHVWDDNEDDGEFERKRATDKEARDQDPHRRALYKLRRRTGDNMIFKPLEYWDDEEVPYEPKDFVTVSWHLVESCGSCILYRTYTSITLNEKFLSYFLKHSVSFSSLAVSNYDSPKETPSTSTAICIHRSIGHPGNDNNGRERKMYGGGWGSWGGKWN